MMRTTSGIADNEDDDDHNDVPIAEFLRIGTSG